MSHSASQISKMTNSPNNADGRFWMLFKDFFKFFNSCTINYTSDKFHLLTISEQIPDETWGVSRLVLPDCTKTAFISLIQMNNKFFDPEEDMPDEEGDKKDKTLAKQLIDQGIDGKVPDIN
jgi:hypothetical protein